MDPILDGFRFSPRMREYQLYLVYILIYKVFNYIFQIESMWIKLVVFFYLWAFFPNFQNGKSQEKSENY